MLPQAQFCKRISIAHTTQTRGNPLSSIAALRSSKLSARIQAKAQQQRREQPAQQVESPESDAEAARIAELEGRKRRKKGRGNKTLQPGASQSTATSSDGFANWPEWQLLPDGWSDMNPIQKAGEIWSGRRGVLFWANKAAWASVFIVGGGWVLFRIVGPITGLYTLKNDLLSPPNL